MREYCRWKASGFTQTPSASPNNTLPLHLPRLQIAPTAMVFIPCRHGYSHRPDEYASPEDIERGVHVLALALAQLAGDAGAEHVEL